MQLDHTSDALLMNLCLLISTTLSGVFSKEGGTLAQPSPQDIEPTPPSATNRTTSETDMSFSNSLLKIAKKPLRLQFSFG